MREVSPDELKGFRPPSVAEHEAILPRMENRCRMELRPMRLWQAFCAVLTATLFADLAAGFSERSIPYNLVLAVLCFAAAAGVWRIRRGKQRTRELLRRLRAKEYEVLDCQASAVLFSARLHSRAEVKIYNSLQQSCSSKFLLDRAAAAVHRDDPSAPLLLMKCCGVYELFSKTELRGTAG